MVDGGGKHCALSANPIVNSTDGGDAKGAAKNAGIAKEAQRRPKKAAKGDDGSL